MFFLKFVEDTISIFTVSFHKLNFCQMWPVLSKSICCLQMNALKTDRLTKWICEGTISKSEVGINLIVHTCFASVNDKCSFCVAIHCISAYIYIGSLFRLFIFKKNFHILCGNKTLQKYFFLELKSTHESERKSLEESFKEKQELLEVC